MLRRASLICVAAMIVHASDTAGWTTLAAGQEPARHDGPPEATKRGDGKEKKADLFEAIRTDEPSWTGEEQPKDGSPIAVYSTSEAAEKAVNRLFEGYDLKPHGLPAIPDDPPPHEGAMIDYPVVIETPDLVLVEVLEALPGRPISGERLVRYDGTLSLGWYGDVHVAGLTVEQARVKIIRHLRSTLSDEALGLLEPKPDDDETPASGPKSKPGLPQAPAQSKKTGAETPGDSRPDPGIRKVHRASRGGQARRAESPKAGGLGGRTSGRAVALRQEPEAKKGEDPSKTIHVPVPMGNQLKITIEIRSDVPPVEAAKGGAGGVQENPDRAPTEVQEGYQVIRPQKSQSVFVDVTAHNSRNYYVTGDIGAPGRLPFTGNETVLDALQFGGGLLHTANPKDIRLVRPARGGKPAKVYKVDLEAIRDRGDITQNYQIFPGDRLVVGRDDTVQKTVLLDRLSAPIQTITNSITQLTMAVRGLQNLEPAKRDAILKNLVDFWSREMTRPEGAKLDDAILRDLLIKALDVKPDEHKPK